MTAALVQCAGHWSTMLHGSMTKRSYSQEVPAATRTIELLELLVEADSGLSTAELLVEMDTSRSGLYALLNTLRSSGYVSSAGGRHHVGPAMRRLTSKTRHSPLPDLIAAFSAETADRGFKETFALTWSDGAGQVVAAETPGAGQIRVSYPPGSRREDERADVTVLQAGEFTDDGALDRVRVEGLARYEDTELVEIAVPICEDGVHPVAAVVAGLPAHLADKPTLELSTQRLRQLGARLSYRIGAGVYQPYGWEAGNGVGPSMDLGPDDLDEFLEGLWSAQLACVRSDGSPHVVPLWYEWDGSNMWLAASPGASWREAIKSNNAVSVTLDEPWPPLRRVFLAGKAHEAQPDEVPGGLRGLRRRLADRYLGRGAADRPELSDTSGWAAIRIDPERIHGRQGLGGGG